MSEQSNRIITVDKLKPGMMIVRVVEQNGPIKFRKVGLVKSHEMVTGLTEMGVQSVEIDFSLSLDIDEGQSHRQTNEVQTPTQQLLRNTQVLAGEQKNTEQYNRALFLPSMTTLPSYWSLYARQSGLLLLLVVGGLCVGWNIAHIPQWTELLMSKDYAELPAVYNNRQANQTDSVMNSRHVNSAKDTDSDANSVNTPSVLNSSSLNGNSNQPTADLNRDIIEQDQDEDLSDMLVLGVPPEETILSSDSDVADEVSQLPIEQQVSPELLKRFNEAVAALENKPIESQPLKPPPSRYDDVPRIDQLPVNVLTKMPAMSFSAHMYASTRDERWVRVNGKRMVEGDFITEELRIVNIEPQRLILSFEGEVFSMASLTDW